MGPKKDSKNGSMIKKEPFSVEIKKEIIAKTAASARASVLAREYRHDCVCDVKFSF